MNIKLMFMLIASSLFAVTGTSNIAYAEKCEDIKGVEKWDGEAHDDNNPSEKEFKEMLNDESVTMCEFAEAIDKEEIEGSIRDWSDFEETTVFMSTSEEVQECLEDRHDLPDSKGKHLADYEVQHCATGNY